MSERVLFHKGEAELSLALTEREWQVMLLLACGVGTGEIAKKLNRSIKTIQTYRERIIEKTGLANNVEIAVQAHADGLTKIENKQILVSDERHLIADGGFYRRKAVQAAFGAV
jgi:DNA-binding CsgD family transcriptional regulator